MTATKKRTYSLAEEQSASEVISAGLTALNERDETVERWLREEVAPAYDALKADPSSAIPAAQVFQELRERLRSPKPA